MDESWTLTVNHAICQGTGLCAGTAPGRFRLDGGKSRPIEDVIDPDDTVLDVAETCPTEAIAIHDSTGRRLAP
jgi:ferredoxin